MLIERLLMEGADVSIYYIDNLDTAMLMDELTKAVEWDTMGGTRRKMAWFGRGEYTYRDRLHKPQDMPLVVKIAKAPVERVTGHTYNGCLANCYENGRIGVNWHSDDESIPGSPIAILSLGATRTFRMMHKVLGISREWRLAAGTVLVMSGPTQENWMHCIPKEGEVKEARISLTYRQTKLTSVD
jgi:alkylated DNA repair dioxygenase AlkB